MQIGFRIFNYNERLDAKAINFPVDESKKLQQR